MRKRSDDEALVAAIIEASQLDPTLVDVLRLFPNESVLRVRLDGGCRPTQVEVWNEDQLEAAASFNGETWQPDMSVQQQADYWRQISAQHAESSAHFAARADALEAEAAEIASR